AVEVRHDPRRREVNERHVAGADEAVRIGRLPAARRRRKEHRGLSKPEGQPDGGADDGHHRQGSDPHAPPHYLTVTRVNLRLPTFRRWTPAGSFAFGSDTRSPSTLTPPCAISRLASDPEAASPSCASVLANGTASAPDSRRTSRSSTSSWTSRRLCTSSNCSSAARAASGPW